MEFHSWYFSFWGGGVWPLHGILCPERTVRRKLWPSFTDRQKLCYLFLFLQAFPTTQNSLQIKAVEDHKWALCDHMLPSAQTLVWNLGLWASCHVTKPGSDICPQAHSWAITLSMQPICLFMHFIPLLWMYYCFELLKDALCGHMQFSLCVFVCVYVLSFKSILNVTLL